MPDARSTPVAADPESGGGARRSVALGALQVAGFAATSALVERAARSLPGFEARGLAQALSAAATASAAAEPGDWTRLVLHDAILPAAAEELLFRGLFYAILRRTVGMPAAVAGSALLFGLAHLDWHHGLVAALLGLQLGLLRERHGLLLAALAHATNNVLAVSLSGWSVDGGVLGVCAVLSGSANAALLQGVRSGR
jgi:membrane protease YdiL (CAAX protease family)